MAVGTGWVGLYWRKDAAPWGRGKNLILSPSGGEKVEGKRKRRKGERMRKNNLFVCLIFSHTLKVHLTPCLLILAIQRRNS